MKNKKLWFCLLGLFLAVSWELSAQIQIDGVSSELEGWTQLEAVAEVTGLKPGLEFETEEALNLFLEGVYQALWNRRYYKTLEVTWKYLDDSVELVHVTLRGSETITLLPLPFYFYDSNSSHNYGAVIWAYNVGGSLMDLYFSGGRSDKYWDLQVKLTRLRLLDTTWGINLRQWWKLIEKSDSTGMLLAYDYNSSYFSLNPPGVKIWDGWSLDPSLNGEWVYNQNVRVETPGQYLESEGFTGGFALNLAKGSGTDWVRNFKKGWSYALKSNTGVNFNEMSFNPTFGVSGGLFDLAGPLNYGVNANLSYRPWGEISGIGGSIRGVTDSFLWGDTSFTFKSGLGLMLFDIPDIVEVQVWTFLDGGVAFERDRPLSLNQVGLGTGLEILIFPHFFKSLIFRATIGFNLIHWGDWEWVIRDGTFL